VILIGPFKKTTNCDRHVASKPNKRSEINIQICAKFMIEGNIKYVGYIVMILIYIYIYIYDIKSDDADKLLYVRTYISCYQVNKL
jgi:hypothetical protein